MTSKGGRNSSPNVCLKKLVAEFQPRYANYEDGLGKVTEYGTIDFEVLCKYGGLDSDMTFRLYWQFTEMLLNEDERLYDY